MTRLQQIEALIGERPEYKGSMNAKDKHLRHQHAILLAEWERKRADIEQARAERWKAECIEHNKDCEFVHEPEPWIEEIDRGES